MCDSTAQHSIVNLNMYGTAQFTVNLTEHTCSKGTIRYFFISHTCKPACARKIGDVKPTIQSSRVWTRRVHDVHVHVRNAHAKFGLLVHANCKPRTAE